MRSSFRTRLRGRLLLLALAVLAGAPGCSVSRMAADAMVPVLANTRDEVNRGDVPRAAREAGPGLLATLDG